MAGMGPTAVIDKSTFQSLTSDEALEFDRYFFQALPTVLFFEIIADLELPSDSIDRNRAKVQSLARKFLGSGPPVIEDFQTMCSGELLGAHVPMTGQVPPQGATVSNTSEGRGMFVDLTPYNHALLRWQSGKFNLEDGEIAKDWRAILAKMETASLSDLFTTHRVIPARCNNLDELGTAVEKLMNTPALQEPLLNWFVSRFADSRQIRRQLVRRFTKSRRMLLRQFAPYTAHCVKATLLLFLGERYALVPQRGTNLIDLQYLYYLPFCMVFISDDRVHKELARLLARTDQEIVRGIDAKASLRAQHDTMGAIPEPLNTHTFRALGLYPYPIKDNVVSMVWSRYMRPWSARNLGLDSEIGPSEREQIVKDLATKFKDADLSVE